MHVQLIDCHLIRENSLLAATVKGSVLSPVHSPTGENQNSTRNNARKVKIVSDSWNTVCFLSSCWKPLSARKVVLTRIDRASFWWLFSVVSITPALTVLEGCWLYLVSVGHQLTLRVTSLGENSLQATTRPSEVLMWRWDHLQRCYK